MMGAACAVLAALTTNNDKTTKLLRKRHIEHSRRQGCDNKEPMAMHIFETNCESRNFHEKPTRIGKFVTNRETRDVKKRALLVRSDSAKKSRCSIAIVAVWLSSRDLRRRYDCADLGRFKLRGQWFP